MAAYNSKLQVMRLGIATVIMAVVGLISFFGLNVLQTGSVGWIADETHLMILFALGVSIPIALLSFLLILVNERFLPSGKVRQIMAYLLPVAASSLFWMWWLIKFKKRPIDLGVFVRDWPTFFMAIMMGLAFAVYWYRSARLSERA